RRIEGLPNVVNHLAFSPDGKALAMCLYSGGLRVFDTATGALLADDAAYDSESYWAAFAADGRLATTCYDGLLRFYDRHWKLLKQAPVDGVERPYCIAFSPDGEKVVVTDSEDQRVVVLRASTIDGPFTPEIGEELFARVTWSADGTTLLAGSRSQHQHQ